MTNDSFDRWFDLVQAYLDQLYYPQPINEQDHTWFYHLYARNWMPAYYAARLYIDAEVTSYA